MFDAMLHAYRAGPRPCAALEFTTLMIFFATLALSVYLFVIIPKGFFPQQDIGLISGTSEATQDISFTDMVRHQEALGKIVQADPDVASVGDGDRRQRPRRQQRQPLHHAEAAQPALVPARSRSSPGCARSWTQVEGARLFMQAAQDVRLGGRPTRTQFEFTLQDADLAELNEWAPKILAKMQTLPELRDVATDQQSKGTTLDADDRPRHRLALRHPAADDRRHAVRRLRPAPGRRSISPSSTAITSSWRCCRSCRAASTR